MTHLARALLIASILLAPALGSAAGQGGAGAADASVGELILIELFAENGCDTCARLKREVFPEFELSYAGGYRWQERDIAAPTNYLRLVQWFKRMDIKDNPPVLIVLDGREALAGFEAIRDGLGAAMERAIEARLAGAVPAGAGRELEPPDPGILRRHVEGFTLAGVLVAAAVDSINPCMVATLVFFLSLLSVSHMGARRMLLAGGAFVAACYATYFLLGLGLFAGLRAMTAVRWIRWIFDAVILAMLSVFAVVSFLDAARYRRTGRPGSVVLKLPDSLQRRIHEVMKRGLHTRRLVAGGLGVGVLVTLMESVCTGQVYIPALALMIRSGQSVAWCSMYLALYNLVFVLPLVILLGLTCVGIGIPALVEWSRRNVVISKTLLGLFFAGMAAMMLALR